MKGKRKIVILGENQSRGYAAEISSCIGKILRFNLRHKMQNKTHKHISLAITIERKFHVCYLIKKTTVYTEDTIHNVQS